jgi:uncharacterized protein YkwD
MRLSNAFVVLVAFTFAACASNNPQQAPVSQPPAPAAEPSNQGPQLGNDEIAKQLLAAVNKQRTDNGLKLLETSPELAASAQEHSDKMSSGNFLSTVGADEASVITRVTSHGVKTLRLGENVIRLKTRPDRVADETMTNWMNAAADRKNILSPAFTKTGFGLTRSADGNYYITQDFAQ